MTKSKIYLSVVIPVYNEEESLENLYSRLTAVFLFFLVVTRKI